MPLDPGQNVETLTRAPTGTCDHCGKRFPRLMCRPACAPWPLPNGGWYTPELRALQSARASGVYAIFERGGRCLYVGESHTGRLFDTITRHFREWRIDPSQDAQGRRRGGTMYDRAAVLVAHVVTEPDYQAIQELRPRDNTNTGETAEARAIPDPATRSTIDVAALATPAPF